MLTKKENAVLGGCFGKGMGRSLDLQLRAMGAIGGFETRERHDLIYMLEVS